MNNQKQVKASVGLVAVVAASTVVGAFAASFAVKTLFSRSASHLTVDAALTSAADQLNRQLPMMVDKNTRLDSTTAIPGGKFMYRYTIVGFDQLPDSEAFAAQIRPSLVNGYRTSADMAAMRKAEATLIYSYFTEDGEQYARFEIPVSDL